MHKKLQEILDNINFNEKTHLYVSLEGVKKPKPTAFDSHYSSLVNETKAETEAHKRAFSLDGKLEGNEYLKIKMDSNGTKTVIELNDDDIFPLEVKKFCEAVNSQYYAVNQNPKEDEFILNLTPDVFETITTTDYDEDVSPYNVARDPIMVHFYVTSYKKRGEEFSLKSRERNLWDKHKLLEKAHSNNKELSVAELEVYKNFVQKLNDTQSAIKERNENKDQVSVQAVERKMEDFEKSLDVSRKEEIVDIIEKEIVENAAVLLEDTKIKDSLLFAEPKKTKRTQLGKTINEIERKEKGFKQLVKSIGGKIEGFLHSVESKRTKRTQLGKTMNEEEHNNVTRID